MEMIITLQQGKTRNYKRDIILYIQLRSTHA